MIDEMRVEDVVMDMAGFGVVYAEHRELDDGTTVLELRLYDIVRDFARQEAKKQGEETMWPAKLLDAYRAAYGAEEPSPLWIFNVKSDEVGGYKTQNVCRLLSAAWRSDEIGSILHSARWSVKMQESSKIAQLEDDVQLYSRKTPQKYRAERNKMVSDRRSIAQQEDERDRWPKALCKVVPLSFPYSEGNSHVAWFQLLGYSRRWAGRGGWMK